MKHLAALTFFRPFLNENDNIVIEHAVNVYSSNFLLTLTKGFFVWTMTNVNISTLLLCILVLYFKDKSPPRTNQLPEKLKYHRIVLGKLNYYWPCFSLGDATWILWPDHLLPGILPINCKHHHKLNPYPIFGFTNDSEWI